MGLELGYGTGQDRTVPIHVPNFLCPGHIGIYYIDHVFYHFDEFTIKTMIINFLYYILLFIIL
jgi:hypothetical protein